MSSFLHRFAAEFAGLDADKLERLGELYSDDVHFTDPLHEVVGLIELQRYFAELYANVEIARPLDAGSCRSSRENRTQMLLGKRRTRLKSLHAG